MTLALTYPGGELKTITIAATAGNVVTNKSPGARKRWILQYGIVTLVTDATVANRVIKTEITDGTNILTQFQQTPNITASLTRALVYNDMRNDNADIPSGSICMVTIEGKIIEGADQLRITVDAGVAGDSYSGYIRVLELGL